MDNFLGSIFHDIFFDILKNSTKQFRYFVVTICFVALLTFGILAILKQTEIEAKLFISVLIFLCLVIYIFVMVKIHKNEKRKNQKKKKRN